MCSKRWRQLAQNRARLGEPPGSLCLGAGRGLCLLLAYLGRIHDQVRVRVRLWARTWLRARAQREWIVPGSDPCCRRGRTPRYRPQPGRACRAQPQRSTNPEQPPHAAGNSLPTRAQASAAFSGQPLQFVAFQEVMRKEIRSPHLTERGPNAGPVTLLARDQLRGSRG
eukprot:scaffold112202_cov36-Phaeocystis_antarctica.AAC.1